MRPNRRIATVFALGLLGANVFVLSGTAGAATPTCLGEKATKVGTNKSETINGTSGDDVIVARGGSDKINGRGGVDIICAGGGNDIISGGGGPDYILGQGGNDTLKGGAWRDFLLGGPGNDTFKGGADPDTVWFDLAPGPVSVDLAAGTATGEGSDKLVSGIDAISGSPFGDTLAGNEGTNFFFGNDGDDTITGLGDLDLITPGDGDDVVDGGTEDGQGFDLDIVYFTGTRAVTVNLQTGTATGQGTDDLSNLEAVYGSDSNDNITGDNNSNILFGGPGNDALDGGGGPALDYASYWFATEAVVANLQTGETSGGDGNDTLVGIEGLLGTIDFGDELTGDDAKNYLDGDGGDDILTGGGEDDLFLGGAGNDTMIGGAGDFDMADYYCGGCDLNADLTTGEITGDGTDTVSGLEAVGADDGNDTLIGDEWDNYFYGWGGDDYIQGGGGDDKIDGGGGDNYFDGGPGNDYCTRYLTEDNCEEVGTTPMEDHPLRESAELVGTFRRNF